MPRLIPKIKMPNFIANAMIPDEIKQKAIEAMGIFTGAIDVDQFRDLVTLNVSLWQKCLNDELRDKVIANSGEYKTWIKLANESLILEWVVEARPDLETVLSTDTGRLWFYRQWTEISRALGV